MAVVVLCSIAAGAIVTLLRGPWMWTSLLVLPAAAAISILLLYRLDDSILRRSLQIAILASLAMHLLILIVSSLTFIFGFSVPEQQVVVSNQPQRRIVVSNKTKPFVFQQPQQHSLPDIEVEPEKKQTTTQTKPQPVPVVEQKKTVDHQTLKRRVEQATVPRLDQQQSKRSQSRKNVKPRVSKSMKMADSSSASPSATAANLEATPTESEVGKSAKSEKKVSQKSASASTATQRMPQAVSSRRTTNAAEVMDAANAATARIRRSEAKIPKIARQKSANNESKPQSVSEPAVVAKSEPSDSAIARRQTTSSRAKKSSSSPQTEIASPLASDSQRRRTKAEVQNVTRSTVSKKSNRQTIAKTPTLKREVQLNQTAASSATSQVTPQPKSIAVTRSTSGTSGSGRSKNLNRLVGGQPSPVNLASDSSNKRQSSRSQENISMTSLQRSNKLERGRAESPKRILRSDNSLWAKRSGSNVPAETTAQAAAANIDSATTAQRHETATEKGSSMLDIGATKVVPEMISDRRGGGGLPEISNLSVQQTRANSGRQSNQVPNVARLPAGQESGPPVQAEAVALSDEKDDSGEQISRESKRPNDSHDRGKADNSIAETTVPSTASLASRATRRDSSSANTDFTAEQTGQTMHNGNARTRLAQAPTVDRQLEFGTAGQQPVQVLDSGSADDLSTAEMVRRATDTMTGGSMLGTASRVVANSMANSPVFDNGSSDGERRTERDSIVAAQEDTTSDSRTGNKLQPKVDGLLSVAVESTSSASGHSDSLSEILMTDSDTSGITRQSVANSMSEAAVELELDADPGSGGFSDIVTRRVGKISDLTTESENVSPNSETRFKRKEFGGIPAVSPFATIAKEAFRSRNPAELSNSGPKTEAAIESGLEFLARHQLADGSWTLGQFDVDDPLYQNQLNSDTAATGLALLAFQGAGYNHREFKYANQIRLAIDWLVSHQTDSGGLYVESDKASNESSRLYSHAIAALALTEAYGMTQDPVLQQPTQKALDYIAATQDTKKGGWRYFANIRMRSSDTSVSGWMMMALKSGKLAGLETRESTMERIEAWLRVAEVPNSSSEFRYNPYAVDSEGKSRSHGRNASITMTSVGLLMRVYTGWGPKDPKFLQGADVLLRQLPGDQDSRTRDTYYWYYATQVMKHAGGQYWEKWSSALHPLLIGTQETSGEMRGSWHPYRPVPDRWGPQGGRIYVTTMNLLSLEVKYRLLPLYENTIHQEELDRNAP